MYDLEKLKGLCWPDHSQRRGLVGAAEIDGRRYAIFLDYMALAAIPDAPEFSADENAEFVRKHRAAIERVIREAISLSSSETSTAALRNWCGEFEMIKTEVRECSECGGNGRCPRCGEGYCDYCDGKKTEEFIVHPKPRYGTILGVDFNRNLVARSLRTIPDAQVYLALDSKDSALLMRGAEAIWCIMGCSSIDRREHPNIPVFTDFIKEDARVSSRSQPE